jgi:hypothetical protein
MELSLMMNAMKFSFLLFFISYCAPEKRKKNTNDFSNSFVKSDDLFCVKGEHYSNGVCHDCEPGHKCINDNKIKCPVGTFQNEKKKYTCNICSNDSFVNKEAATTCEKCETGSDTKDTNTPSQCKCSAGYFLHDENEKCTICPAGHICNNTIKTKCNEGEFQDKTGQTQCKKCLKNTYNDTKGQSKCKAVLITRACASDANNTCRTTIGATTQLCKPGFEGEKCLPLPTKKYWDSKDSKSVTRGNYTTGGYSRNVFALGESETTGAFTHGKKYVLLKSHEIKSNDSADPNIADIKDALEVTAGRDYFCVLLSDEKVNCYGTNEYMPSTKDLKHIKQISSAKDHTCVLTHNDEVWCGGSNGYGQLGNKTKISSKANNPFTKVKEISNAKKVFTGETQSCALLKDNSLKCWGTHDSKPSIREIGNKIKQVSIGFYHICYVDNEHQVTCKSNKSSDNKEYLGPTNHTNIISNEPVREVLARKDYSCALLFSGQVKCWGDLTKLRKKNTTFTPEFTTNTKTPILISYLDKCEHNQSPLGVCGCRGLPLPADCKPTDPNAYHTGGINKINDYIISINGNNNDICVLYLNGELGKESTGTKEQLTLASCLSEELKGLAEENTATSNNFITTLKLNGDEPADVYVGATKQVICAGEYYCPEDKGLRFTALPGFYAQGSQLDTSTACTTLSSPQSARKAPACEE